MEDKIKEEIEKMEHDMLELESEHRSFAFRPSDMFEKQLLINQSLLKIIKKISDHLKEEDWI